MIAFATSNIILNIVSLFVLFSAIWVSFSKKLYHSVVAMGFISLFCCIVYLNLNAPDVAMTEAALGVCITTIIMLKVASNLSPKKELVKKNRIFALIICILFASFLIYAGSDLAEFGDPNSPVHSHVIEYYHENTYSEIGIPSFVAAILASYRGYDTFGETIVIYIAGICTIFILSFLEEEEESEFKKDLIIYYSAKFIFPVIAAFSLFVQLSGTISPGGGFQAGAIVASLYMIMNLSMNYKIRRKVLVFFSSLGVCIYMIPGIIALITGYEFLNYNALNLGSISQKIGIEVVEVGIAITVSSTIVILYQCFFGTKIGHSK